ncbi:hypothetical protein PROFUN_01065 [Planoprotostelium fungivorum]|uniref:Right handed beta helix domain-containing protein n=1 Tax=Planoprotostelium fungivorum TaxID=1890364 RepID=A0A2P6NC93_9EUKA|nr:hypothetical protein PROFUN_01065 [Planoprotostelium fungivorum]
MGSDWLSLASHPHGYHFQNKLRSSRNDFCIMFEATRPLISLRFSIHPDMISIARRHIQGGSCLSGRYLSCLLRKSPLIPLNAPLVLPFASVGLVIRFSNSSSLQSSVDDASLSSGSHTLVFRSVAFSTHCVRSVSISNITFSNYNTTTTTECIDISKASSLSLSDVQFYNIGTNITSCNVISTNTSDMSISLFGCALSDSQINDLVNSILSSNLTLAVENCTFNDNGGMYRFGRYFYAQRIVYRYIHLTSSRFFHNHGFNLIGQALSLVVTDCDFVGAYSVNSSDSLPLTALSPVNIIHDCRFYDTGSAVIGGSPNYDMYVEVYNCSFRGGSNSPAVDVGYYAGNAVMTLNLSSSTFDGYRPPAGYSTVNVRGISVADIQDCHIDRTIGGGIMHVAKPYGNSRLSISRTFVHTSPSGDTTPVNGLTPAAAAVLIFNQPAVKMSDVMIYADDPMRAIVASVAIQFNNASTFNSSYSFNIVSPGFNVDLPTLSQLTSDGVILLDPLTNLTVPANFYPQVICDQSPQRSAVRTQNTYSCMSIGQTFHDQSMTPSSTRDFKSFVNSASRPVLGWFLVVVMFFTFY